MQIMPKLNPKKGGRVLVSAHLELSAFALCKITKKVTPIKTKKTPTIVMARLTRFGNAG